MVWPILKRPMIYKTLGTCLLSGGIILGCFLGSRLAREEIDGRIAQQSYYLVIDSTPVFELPPATPPPTSIPTRRSSSAMPLYTSTSTPTPIPTPSPTPTPPPLPPIRLSIPAINLNTTIIEVSPVTEISWTGDQKQVWKVASFAVGYHNTSGYPTEGTNIVLSGHNNTEGAVFLHLSELNIGDEVVIFTADDEFHYQVQEKTIIPHLGNETEADAKLRFYAAPKPAEMVTLISCWPYATNADRIVVIAIPISEDNKHAP